VRTGDCSAADELCNAASGVNSSALSLTCSMLGMRGRSSTVLPPNTETRFCCGDCGAENRDPGWCQLCKGRTEAQLVKLLGPADAPQDAPATFSLPAAVFGLPGVRVR